MPIIEVNNISKKYKINANRGGYIALRDVLTNAFKNPFKYAKDKTKSMIKNKEEFWALRDISFSVEKGETIGIIGANGAGKSTLLKILSQITPPTTGEIKLNGRVASLLEVGTGFNPELTGRENIFLNGAILGMTKQEIQKKFDEIVEFSGIEKFIDTPAKRYSSGMFVRLAFAVAAHMEPDILLVDEVLAVGDLEFQKKCLGKMGEVTKREGRTILFVSHNMGAVQSLCPKSILLKKGKITMIDNSEKVIKQYKNEKKQITSWEDVTKTINNIPSDPAFKLKSVNLYQKNKQVFNYIENEFPVEIKIKYQVYKKITGLRIFFDLYDSEETLLFRSFHDENHTEILRIEPGEYTLKAVIPGNLLGPLKYELCINAGIHAVRYCIPLPGICIPINVKTNKNNNTYFSTAFRGKLAFPIKWGQNKI